MPRPKQLTRAEKKAALMQRAEALIEQLLDWTETTSQPNLTQIEDVALDLRQQFGQALSESAIVSQENVEPVNLPACPACGKPMRPKGRKDKTVVARVGELKLERSHFYCPDCEQGLFPPR
jgi:DNA repair exonuclease SbcCD ATPase subunit